MEQNSHTRARRQHSMVPWTKALRAQTRSQAHRQRSATEGNRNTLKNEPIDPTGAEFQHHTSQHNATEFSTHHGDERSRAEKLICCSDTPVQYADFAVMGA